VREARRADDGSHGWLPRQDPNLLAIVDDARNGEPMDEPSTAPTATDPVCGMQVDTRRAAANGLVAEYEGQTYYFCGRGCLLDFREDPGKFFDPKYVPQM